MHILVAYRNQNPHLETEKPSKIHENFLNINDAKPKGQKELVQETTTMKPKEALMEIDKINKSVKAGTEEKI